MTFLATRSSSSDAAPFYIAGGSLPNDAPSYVDRQADSELLRMLESGEFCYVLDTRQVGKSSLMVRTASRLREAGFGVVVLDLSAAGQNVTLEQWYFGLLYSIADQLGMDEELETFWTLNAALGPVQRWIAALRQVVLPRLDRPLVIFVDEIDSVRSLPFCVDELFAAIRECHNRRTEDPVFTRLTFCLLGVATPAGLIRNAHTTPFNIGRRIELNDFTQTEAAPLARGLSAASRDGAALLNRVLYWTGGHPYLTQRLCRAIAENEAVRRPRHVDRLCAALFLDRQARDADDNLTFVRDRVLDDKDPAVDSAGFLDLYARIRLRREAVRDDPTDARIAALRLAGVVRGIDGVLSVRNRIYERVFGPAWVQDNMPGAEIRRQRRALRRGFMRATAVWACLTFFAVAAYAQFLRARIADANVSRIVGEKRRLAAENETLRGEQLSLQRSMRQFNLQIGRAKEELAALRRSAASTRAQMGAAMARSNSASRSARDANRRAIETKQRTAAQVAAARDEARGALAVAYAHRPGLELRALKLARDAIVESGSAGRKPPSSAVQGLVDAACTGEFRLFRVAHADASLSVGFSPDGSKIISAGKDRTVRLWDAFTGKPLGSLPDALKMHRKKINSAEFSHNGQRILTASDDRLCLWDAHSHRLIESRDIPIIDSFSATFSPDDGLIAVTALDSRNTPAILDAQHIGARPHALLKGHTDYVWSIGFRPDGGRVVTASADRSARVWNADTGEQLASFTGHRDQVTYAAFAPRDPIIASTGYKGDLYVWDAWNGRLIRTYAGDKQQLWSVAFSPDGNLMATGNRDGSCFIWNLHGGSDTEPLFTLPTHMNDVYAVQFSPDGRRIATAGKDGAVEVWSLPNAILPAPDSQINMAAFSPDSTRVVSANADNSVTLWDFRSHAIRRFWGAEAGVMNVAFSPDGNQMVTASKDGAIRLYPLRREYAAGSSEQKDGFRQMVGHRGTVYCASFSPDCRRIVSAGQDGILCVWDAATGASIRVMKGHTDDVLSAAWSPDGRFVVSAGRDGTVRIWNPESGQGRIVGRHDSKVWDAGFSPDGQRIISASVDQTARVWDARTGKQEAILRGHGSDVMTASFSEDGKRVITASLDRMVRVWNVHDMRAPVLTLPAHHGNVLSARFSPDRRWIVTAGDDRTVRIFPSTVDGFVRHADRILSGQVGLIGRVASTEWMEWLDFAARPGVASPGEQKPDLVAVGEYSAHRSLYEKAYARLGATLLGHPVAPCRPGFGCEYQEFDGGTAHPGGALYYNPAQNAVLWVRGAIFQHYVRLGAERSPLGLPILGEHGEITEETVGPAYSGHTGKVSRFEHGSIYHEPTVLTFEVLGDIDRVYRAYGGPAGPMGFPTEPAKPALASPNGITGDIQRFQTGDIYRSDRFGTFAVYGSINYDVYVGKYHGSPGPYGFPKSAPYEVAGKLRQDFEGGTISVDGPVIASVGEGSSRASLYQESYRKLGGQGAIGTPIGRVRPWGPTEIQEFDHGPFGSTALIYLPRERAVFWIRGAIWATYEALGGYNCPLGLPQVSENGELKEIGVASRPSGKTGTMVRFEHGVIFWGEGIGTHAVSETMMEAYGPVDPAVAWMGFPTIGAELAVFGDITKGYVQRFEGGVIYSSPRFGAFTVYAPILTEYERRGGPAGPLGMPISRRYEKDGEIRQDFEHGSIHIPSRRPPMKPADR